VLTSAPYTECDAVLLFGCQTVVRNGAAGREGFPVQPGLQHELAVGRDAPRDLRQPRPGAALHQPAAAVTAAHDGVERVRGARPQGRHLLRRPGDAVAGHGAGRVRRKRHRRGHVQHPPAQEVTAQQRQEDQGPGQDQDGVHRKQAEAVHDVLKEEDWHHEEGEITSLRDGRMHVSGCARTPQPNKKHHQIYICQLF
jgi:hypothetical protein